MRINDYRAAQIAQNYGLPGATDTNARAKKPDQRTDGASLSPAAQSVLTARRAVQESQEVRADLVAELRRQVQEGTYRVDDRALARRIFPLLDLEA
jgi:flagellar biosynthesis anti-sigma factor FlgM